MPIFEKEPAEEEVDDPEEEAAISSVPPITTTVEPTTSRREGQLTFFISASVAIMKSTMLGLFSSHHTSRPNPPMSATAMPPGRRAGCPPKAT